MLTHPGLTNIVALVEQGRTIYQRILTWIINKISQTILKSAFVCVAFLVTGKFIVSVFTMLLLTLMTDFAKIALATDRVQSSRSPETWNIGGFVAISAVLGVAMVAEALLCLWIAWGYLNLAAHDDSLYTVSFLLLLYFAEFSVVSVRERRPFWSSSPSHTLLAASFGDIAVGTGMTRIGLPGLAALPWSTTAAIFAYALLSSLVVNDTLKVAMIKWRFPSLVTPKEPGSAS